MRYRLSVNMFAINVFAMGWFLLGLTFIAKAEDPPPPPPGEFVIQTMVKRTYLTAVEGGGRTTNVIHTDAKRIGSWEKFRLLGRGRPSRGEYVVQTVSGNYLTALNGGGLSGPAVVPGGQTWPLEAREYWPSVVGPENHACVKREAQANIQTARGQIDQV